MEILKCSTNSIDYHEIIECIAYALDAKDTYTVGHSQRVTGSVLLKARIVYK